MQNMREKLLQAACTIQYDSACVSATQQGVEVLDEPFTRKQQMQSRFDGGIEADGETCRPCLEITPSEPQGHVMREISTAEAQQRSERNAYRSVPLTGCHQSMLPTYRSNAAFGKIADCTLNEHGLCEAFAMRRHG